MALLADLSAAENCLFTLSRLAEVPVAEGCAVVVGTAEGNCKLPGGALASRVLGISRSAGTSNGVDEKISINCLGEGPALLGATLSIAEGDELVVANASGHLRKRVVGDAAGCVVGTSRVTRTAGALPEFITIYVNPREIVGL